MVASGDIEQGQGEEKDDGDDCDDVCHRNLERAGLGSTASVLPLESEVPDKVGG